MINLKYIRFLCCFFAFTDLFSYVCRVKCYRMKLNKQLILYHNKLIYPYVKLFLNILMMLSYLASAGLVAAVIYEKGFPVSEYEYLMLNEFYHVAWIVMLTNTLAHMILGFKDTRLNYNALTWLLTILLLLTLIPVFFHQPGEEYVEMLKFWNLMQSKTYRLIILIIISLFDLSNGIVRLLGKRTNPSLILAGSFFLIIMVGAVLLKLPNSTYNGISWYDSLFLSTSAVCVTGLSPFDMAETFTPVGFSILLVLIQIGGLGVMTFTSFFALFFMGNTSVYNQVMVRDMVNSNSLNSLLSTLFDIFIFTLTIEVVGMVVIWMTVHGTLSMTFEDEVYFSVFHAISAFCNSGMSSLAGGGVGSPLLQSGHIPFFLSLSVLAILGGLGFPILVNLKDMLFFRAKSLWHFIRTHHWSEKSYYHLFNLNTRIVLIFTLILLTTGTACFLMLEWDGVLKGMSVPDKITQAFFMAVCPRSVGFTAHDPSEWRVQTMMLYGLLMWIGGGAQSTAGGIKVNAFAVIVFNIIALLRGTERVEIFGRELSVDSIRRSNATALMSIFTLFCFILAMSCVEPDIPFRGIFYECLAAITTSGVGLGITPELGDTGKLLITLLMFIGRVGLITVLLGVIKQKKHTKYRYPNGEIIIN